MGIKDLDARVSTIKTEIEKLQKSVERMNKTIADSTTDKDSRLLHLGDVVWGYVGGYLYVVSERVIGETEVSNREYNYDIGYRIIRLESSIVEREIYWPDNYHRISSGETAKFVTWRVLENEDVIIWEKDPEFGKYIKLGTCEWNANDQVLSLKLDYNYK